MTRLSECIRVNAYREAGADVANAVDMQLKDRNTNTGRLSYRLLALLVELTQEQNSPSEGLHPNVLLPTHFFQKATEIFEPKEI